MPTVLNKLTDRIPSDAVYIGRPSKWGNPYVIGRDGTRATVVARYHVYLLEHPDLYTAAQTELCGKDLVCWCAPLPCHGDVLLRIANGAD